MHAFRMRATADSEAWRPVRYVRNSAEERVPKRRYRWARRSQRSRSASRLNDDIASVGSDQGVGSGGNLRDGLAVVTHRDNPSAIDLVDDVARLQVLFAGGAGRLHLRHHHPGRLRAESELLRKALGDLGDFQPPPAFRRSADQLHFRRPLADLNGERLGLSFSKNRDLRLAADLRAPDHIHQFAGVLHGGAKVLMMSPSFNPVFSAGP